MQKLEVYKCRFCGLSQWMDDIKEEYNDKYYYCKFHCNKYCHYCDCVDCIIDMPKEKRIEHIRHKIFIMRQAMDGYNTILQALDHD